MRLYQRVLQAVVRAWSSVPLKSTHGTDTAGTAGLGTLPLEGRMTGNWHGDMRCCCARRSVLLFGP